MYYVSINGEKMIKVIATNYLKPEYEETFKPLFLELIEATCKENGCIEYRLFKKTDEKGIYTFIEEWENQSALDKHMASEHFTRIIPQISRLTITDGAIQTLEEFK
jgi:quinol monooxygenase YgiN